MVGWILQLLLLWRHVTVWVKWCDLYFLRDQVIGGVRNTAGVFKTFFLLCCVVQVCNTSVLLEAIGIQGPVIVSQGCEVMFDCHSLVDLVVDGQKVAQEVADAGVWTFRAHTYRDAINFRSGMHVVCASVILNS